MKESKDAFARLPITFEGVWERKAFSGFLLVVAIPVYSLLSILVT